MSNLFCPHVPFIWAMHLPTQNCPKRVKNWPNSGASVAISSAVISSLSLLGSHNVEVVTGVNLPMLLKVFTCREKPLAELAKLAGEAGTKGIVVAGSMLRSRNKEKTGD